jgi:hypothetical protein
MNSLTVCIWTKTEGEIKKFLERYYKDDIHIDNDVDEWNYVYGKPVESVDIISAIMDNRFDFDLNVGIRVNEEKLYRITDENYNDVIKDIFELFYEEHE